MRQTWRWFGPADPVSLADVRQAGAEGVVTALHGFAAGAEWPRNAIAERRKLIEEAGLTWDVVESLPVSENIKTQSGDWRGDMQRYRASLKALAAEGIQTICYNFMPVLDWTRTELHHRRPHGGTAMRFDLPTFAMFDIYILARPGAAQDYSAKTCSDAENLFSETDKAQAQALTETITCGLPGAVERWSLDDLKAGLARYDAVSAEQLRQHHIDFLSELAPMAEDLGLRLCCHPDDPPWTLLGLPRIASTLDDYAHLLNAVDSPAVGMTFCTGSLGARPDNDCAQIVRALAPKIHFVHLRNVTRETPGHPCSFFEDEHLDGGTDMVAVLRALLDEEARRRAEGRAEAEIPFRPDHGQAILSDLAVDGQPGYPAVGRLKGLAELRGIIAALTHPEVHA
ncbi:mannonate dehydratase [Gymnodinialimonas sp. 2305UL16-5]|uniref:mannonate dehydratase n=1 Tax=Gymnodinialimonas mytili TaxID=3126503 RepID=UPI0030A54CF7